MTPELKRKRPARPLPGIACREFCLVCLLDRTLGALIKVLARLCWGEPARRPEQQANAAALFKLSDKSVPLRPSAQLTCLLFADEPFEARRLRRVDAGCN
jgi:hypothetical protein